MAGRILIVCLLLAAAPAPFGAPSVAAKPAPYKDPKLDKAFRKRVHEAIEKGCRWLIAKQTASGQFPAFEDGRGAFYELGMHCLATLAVMKGLGDLEAKPILKALRKVKSLHARHRNTMYTYEVGLMLMVLDAKVFTKPHPFMPKAQAKKLLKQAKKRKPLAVDQTAARDLVLWLQSKQKTDGFWRYPQNGMDLSNTQYAALGLWSASRLGIPVDNGVVRRMIEETLRLQQKRGTRVPFFTNPRLAAQQDRARSSTSIEAKGWRYMLEEKVKGADGKMRKIPYPYSGSMTSAGIAVLGIGRNILGKDDAFLKKGVDAKLRRAMWEGLAWLQANWELKDNPGQPGNWPFYWLYGLERAARIANVEFVGRRDWYYEGAIRLLDDQRPDGSWPLRQRMRPKGDQNVQWWSDQVDTAFAILFLTLSTPGVETPPPVISGN